MDGALSCQSVHSTAIAVASPPPMHSEATPRRNPRVFKALINVTTSRAPLAPIGWPDRKSTRLNSSH